MAYADLKIDYVFRRVFGQHPDVLMGLLNDLLERTGPSEITSLEYLPPDQVPEVEGMKWPIVDVKCREASGTTFVVEMQVLYRTGFLNRIVYNACRAFTARLKRGEGYETLTPVVAVTVCDFELWPDAEHDATGRARVPLVSHWRMAEKHGGAVGIPQIEYVFCELTKLGDRAPRTPGEQWAAVFRDAHRWTTAEAKRLELSPAQMTALALSNEATFTEDEVDAYRRAREEYEQLRVAFEDVARKNRAMGHAEGHAEGLAEGLRDGELRAKRATLRALCTALGVALTSADEARIDACADVAALDAWIAAVATTRAF